MLTLLVAALVSAVVAAQVAAPSQQAGFAEVCRHWRQRHGRSAAERSGAADDQGARGLSIRPGHHARRQHVRRAVDRQTSSGSSSSPTRRCSRQVCSSRRRWGTTTSRENVNYKLYNMNGQRYYSYARGNVRFFALDTTRMDAKQLAWIDDLAWGGTRGLEDLLLPSPAVFECRPPWRLGRSARAARTAVRQARRQRGLRRPRPRLRAASSRRRASITSSRARPESCERAT